MNSMSLSTWVVFKFLAIGNSSTMNIGMSCLVCIMFWTIRIYSQKQYFCVRWNLKKTYLYPHKNKFRNTVNQSHTLKIVNWFFYEISSFAPA